MLLIKSIKPQYFQRLLSIYCQSQVLLLAGGFKFKQSHSTTPVLLEEIHALSKKITV
ncbi:hypothetical protein THIOM_002902 [Candidatus Thiomargarita nelsonii]|uniref:Uncharacterized protein n=1 Tax=Candidatus Thiomargarita nelsonii TaxID=1003181 RepID=A0A176S011_9GAMM|nr:hypothetical protein THIOM_002902 [Candidatus Thiomargarita nelsonii]